MGNMLARERGLEPLPKSDEDDDPLPRAIGVGVRPERESGDVTEPSSSSMFSEGSRSTVERSISSPTPTLAGPPRPSSVVTSPGDGGKSEAISAGKSPSGSVKSMSASAYGDMPPASAAPARATSWLSPPPTSGCGLAERASDEVIVSDEGMLGL